MTVTLDWWQVGWALAGFFMVLFFGLALATHGSKQRGYDAGWHDRQHWETDKEIGGKLERA